MSEYKFKVGDRVRLLDGSSVKYFANGWHENMRSEINSIQTIVRIFEDIVTQTTCYRLSNGWVWDERCMKLVFSDKSAFKVGDSVELPNGQHTKVTKIDHDQVSVACTKIMFRPDELTIIEESDCKAFYKFKVGDKVQINYNPCAKYSIDVNECMAKHNGQICNVTTIDPEGSVMLDDGFWWDSRALKPLIFKVGDLVKVLDGSKEPEYMHGWTENMATLVGTIQKISRVNDDGSVEFYDVAEMFDPRYVELVESGDELFTFKVGDKVRVLDGSKAYDYKHGWVSDMLSLVGTIQKVKCVNDDGCVEFEGAWQVFDYRYLELVARKDGPFEYKVGDKVRILDGSKIPDYVTTWNTNMDAVIGLISTINRVDTYKGIQVVMVEDSIWHFDSRYIELVERKDD